MSDLGERLNKKLLNRFGDVILPTNISGRLETGWHAFDRFCPIELGTSLMIWGPSQSGKSLMMMMLGAAVQKKGGLFICFNTEAANRDVGHLTKVVPSLKYNKILFYQPDYIEYVVESIHEIINLVDVDSAPVFISIDSINSCSTKRELSTNKKGQIEFVAKDMSGAEIAGIWSKALRQFTNRLSKKPIVLCLVSQVRTGGIGSYVTKDIWGGGAAPYFYSSTVLKTYGKSFLYLNEDGAYKKKPEFTLQDKDAQECIIELQKSRYSAGGSKLEYTIDFHAGINVYEGFLDILLYNGIITKAGNSYSYGDTKLGVGKDKVKEALMGNDVLLKELLKKLNSPK